VRGAKAVSREARYNLACAYALASGKDADKKEQHAKRSVELLRGLVEGDLAGLSNPKDDPDFALLIAHDDFKQLVADWQKAAGKRK
jgi:hypothetical protein